MAPKENHAEDHPNKEEEDDLISTCSSSNNPLAEYESRFDEIDSKLDALRSSLNTKEEGGDNNDDEEEEKEATVDTVSYTLNIAAMQASLAEESAKEMEEIVQGLKEEEEQGQHHNVHEEEKVETKNPETRTDQPTTTAPFPAASPASNRSKQFLLFVLVPALLAMAGVAWKFGSLQQQLTVTVSLQRQPSTTIQYQESRKRQICRTNIYGEPICESEQEQQSRSYDATAAATTHQNNNVNANTLVRNHHNPQTATTNYKYARQTCRYVNGQSYCETYEQSQTATNT